MTHHHINGEKAWRLQSDFVTIWVDGHHGANMVNATLGFGRHHTKLFDDFGGESTRLSHFVD